MATVTERTKGMSALSIVYCGMFAALMMIGANITAFAPFLVVGGVPITLQAFFAVLAGALLGSRLGAMSVIVYICVGLAGAPVFARFSGGFGSLISPNFGFLLAFVVAAYIVGKIIEKNSKLSSYISAALIGMVVSYVIGTNWMYIAYKFWAAAPDAFTYKVAWMWMMVPLPKDIVLAVFAGIFGHRVHKIVKVRR